MWRLRPRKVKPLTHGHEASKWSDWVFFFFFFQIGFWTWTHLTPKPLPSLPDVTALGPQCLAMNYKVITVFLNKFSGWDLKIHTHTSQAKKSWNYFFGIMEVYVFRKTVLIPIEKCPLFGCDFLFIRGSGEQGVCPHGPVCWTLTAQPFKPHIRSCAKREGFACQSSEADTIGKRVLGPVFRNCGKLCDMAYFRLIIQIDTFYACVCVMCSVISHSLQPHGL